MEALRACDRVRAPAKIRRDGSRERPDHRARPLHGEIPESAALQHTRDTLRCRTGFVLLAVNRRLVVLHLIDELLLRGDLILHRKACLTRLLLERFLCRTILLELLLQREHCIALREHLVHEVVILLDDTLQEIHTRQEIREILRTKEHVHIGDLPVDVNIAHALAEGVTLALVVPLGNLELLLVLLKAFEGRIQLGTTRLMLCNRRIRLLVEDTLLLRERVDLARERVALAAELLNLRVIAVALLFERRRRSLPCGEEYGGKRCRERLFHEFFHM